MNRLRLLLWTLYWFSMATAFWGAYEIAYQSPLHHPLWSGTFGSPVLHHYIVGFALSTICIILLGFGKAIKRLIDR